MGAVRTVINYAFSLPADRAEAVMAGEITVLGGVPRMHLDVEMLVAVRAQGIDDGSDARRVAVAARPTPRRAAEVLGTVFIVAEAVYGRSSQARYRINDESHDGDMPHQQGGLWLFGPVGIDPFDPPQVIENQREHNEWEEGRRYWLLRDPVRSGERCPYCYGSGLSDPTGRGDWCPVCDGQRSRPLVQIPRGHGTTGMWNLPARLGVTS